AIAVAVSVASLGIFANQERIRRIRAHIEVHQVAITALAITLSAAGTHHRPREAVEFAELLFSGGVVKVRITLFTDYRGRHSHLIVSSFYSHNCTPVPHQTVIQE